MKRARTKQAKDARRQRLLDAALDEFFERGYAAARMDDIARRADVSKGTLYLYFKSKEELFNGLVETVSMPKLDQIRALLHTQDSLQQALHALGEFAPLVIKQSKLPRFIKVIIGESNTFPALVQQYRERVVDRVLLVITETIDAANARGEVAVEQPALMARLVVAPMLFSALWEVVFGTDSEAQVDLPALFALHADVMRAALVKG